jgi:hypothetical protein
MENGGAWMGFHFAGFALTPSDFPQNWDWYHNEFIGAGQYKSNTWRPTSAILKVEDPLHPTTKNLPKTFKSSPNEWYRWKKDLSKNPDIKILLSIDSTSFHWEQVRSSTRSGIAATTLLGGRIQSTGCSM